MKKIFTDLYFVRVNKNTHGNMNYEGYKEKVSNCPQDLMYILSRDKFEQLLKSVNDSGYVLQAYLVNLNKECELQLRSLVESKDYFLDWNKDIYLKLYMRATTPEAFVFQEIMADVNSKGE